MPNRLAHETSPYLQQHAGNPVDWYPWGPEALALARESGKPILLSVGYSACHWCHVMAHESFEDDAVAGVMNRLFVNIKVDREERPDLDQIYQTAHAMLTQRGGGWPLTMFLTADQVPFFGGTYFPKTARYGLPGFVQLLERVRDYHDQNPEEIRTQNLALLNALQRERNAETAAATPTADMIDTAVAQLLGNFDAQHGGFGAAPKFPHPDALELLLRQWQRNGDAAARHAALATLGHMVRGGIYDQLGGGFARYSVDATWSIPHFEKMLYDNGPLLRLCADAFVLSGEARLRDVVDATAAWVMREMQSPAGGYYSTLDADSEGEEGKFYVWTPDAVQAALTPEEYAVTAAHFGLDRNANFEGHFWHFEVVQELPDVAVQLGQSVPACAALLASARSKLFTARESRIRPGRDEKILVAWNALMIQGMAHAARIFAREDWLASARQSLDFVRRTMWRDGRLLATHKDGKTHLNAYLDDYAFLLNALLELLQTGFRTADLAWAEEIADVLLSQFEDAEQGGFYFTSHDHEHLIQRAKPGHDNATPSGNGIAALALQRLAHLTGEHRYAQAAERTLHHFAPLMARQPSGCASLLIALEEFLRPPRIVVLRGPGQDLAAWQVALNRLFLPDTLIVGAPVEVNDLPPLLAKPVSPGVNAWVCEGVSCLPPMASLEDLLATLNPVKVAPANL